MTTLPGVHRHSFALLTDLYQLTMAYGYWRAGVAEREAVFHMFFRVNPFDGEYAVACGLGPLVDALTDFQFHDTDIEYLTQLAGNDERPLFGRTFLDELRSTRLTCDIDAIPEGTVVFAHEPLLRVRGPILQCQIVETLLLNFVNFQTLIATKAARICRATGGDQVLEFGLRRAQGVVGALSASRAAYVGGCAATSNVLAGKLFGIPVRGTHAHSWVLAFESETGAFQAFAAALPNNCVFLVDTFDTLSGVKKAVEVGRQLRARGHEMVGIRLDSGDLASLSRASRRILDDAGFKDAAIVASNDLDEHQIAQLRQGGAPIDVWGVGTKLATGYDQPALGGVYKLACVRGTGGGWEHKVKLSEEPIKVSNPGVLQVRRFRREGRFIADCIFDEETGLHAGCRIVDPVTGSDLVTIGDECSGEDLLAPVLRAGRPVLESPPLASIRDRTLRQLDQLDSAVTRLSDPQQYPVGLEAGLYDLKARLAEQARDSTFSSE